MLKFKKYNKALFAVVILVILFIGFCVWWVMYLQWAHSSFENYYSFRGCESLVEKTDAYGICKLKDGSEIRLVLFDGKWFLDGDLPTGQFLDW